MTKVLNFFKPCVKEASDYILFINSIRMTANVISVVLGIR